MIEPQFQYGLTGKISIIGVLIVVMTLSFLVIVNQIYGDVKIEVLQPHPFDGSGYVMTATEQTTLVKLLWPSLMVCVLAALGFTFVYGIYISHRMAGPLYRIRRILADMSRGDLRQEIRLRNKDEFKPLAQTVNELMLQWRLQIKELKALGEAFKAGDDPGQKECLNRLKSILATFETE